MATSLKMLSFQFISLLIAIVSNKIVIGGGGLDYFAYFAFFQLCASLIFFIDFGFSRSVVYLLSDSMLSKEKFERVSRGAAIIGTVPAFIGAIAFFAFVNAHGANISSGGKLAFVASGSIYLFFAFMGNSCRSIVESQGDFIKSSSLRLLNTATLFLIPTIFTLLNIRSLYIYLVIAAARIIIYKFFEENAAKSKVKIANNEDKLSFEQLMSAVIKNAFFSTTNAFSNFVDRIVLNFVFPTNFLGLYLAISDLASRLSIVTGVNQSQLQARISRVDNRKSSIRSYFIGQILLYFLPAIVISALSKDIVQFYTSEADSEVAHTFTLLVWSGFVLSLSTPAVMLMQKTGRQTILNAVSLSDLLITTSMIIIFVRSYVEIGNLMLGRSGILVAIYTSSVLLRPKVRSNH